MRNTAAQQDTFIPFANPKAAFLQRKNAILAAVSRSFESGQYILGPEVEAFEKAFASWLGLAHVAGCANGTDAIELALRALGVGRRTAVFTVSHTAVATVAAIERAGATPVLVDVDSASYTMCPASLEQTIKHTRETRPDLEPSVIIPVHLYGHPCDMDAIVSIANRHGCRVVEDCAQAHGARYKGRMAGTIGVAGTFSFYPTKNLGALGDGGAVATNDPALAEEMYALRQYGWKDRYISAEAGVNSRLDPIQAAILSVQLEYLEADNAARRRIAAVYDEQLASCGLVLPVAASWAEHVYHLYVVRSEARQELMDFLRQRNIGTAIHYPMPVHLQPAYKGRVLLAPAGLPVTEAIMRSIVSLPMFPQLGEAEVAHVCATLREWASAGS